MTRALGIEIGGTKLQVGLGSDEVMLAGVARTSVTPAEGAAGIRRVLPELVLDLLRDSDLKMTDIAGIGVGFGGPVDTNEGRILLSHQIADWEGFPLKHWLETMYDRPVVLQNDAKTAALAESSLGAGKGYRRIFYITVGSGVGGGLVVDGKVDVGQGLGAGEIGHTWVPDPESGKPDKLEHIASGWSIGKRASRRLGREVTGAQVAELASKGDAVARQVIAESAEALAIGIGNVLALLHPERFIIGGGVSLMGDVWWSPLRAALADHYAFKPFAHAYEVVPAALGEEVVVIGAIQLGLGAKS